MRVARGQLRVIAAALLLAAAGAASVDGAGAAVAQPLERPAQSPGRSAAQQGGGEGAGSGGAAGSAGQFNLWKVGGSLAAVIGVILALRWAGTRLMGGAAGLRGTRAVEVLSRSLIGPRQQLMLVRVGRRVLVLGNSGSQMNTLCEIAEADEVSTLLGLVQQDRGAAAFGSLLGRERREMEAEAGPMQDGSPAAAEDAADDEAVQQTRREIGGLMQKVRMLSKQFRA